MFLKHTSNGHLVEVLALQDLFDPHRANVVGRYNVGEEMPEPALFDKSELMFPSGEDLPNCWLDAHYRDAELKRA
ncbi:MAG: acetyltransferase [Chromatiales bacterium]|nr:acetyltransferase [Chromatiales bacterium]